MKSTNYHVISLIAGVSKEMLVLTTHLFLQLFQQEIKVASGGGTKKRKKKCTSFLFTTEKRPIPTLKLLFEEEIETIAVFLK